jgi:hypothetical protein
MKEPVVPKIVQAANTGGTQKATDILQDYIEDTTNCILDALEGYFACDLPLLVFTLQNMSRILEASIDDESGHELLEVLRSGSIEEEVLTATRVPVPVRNAPEPPVEDEEELPVPNQESYLSKVWHYQETGRPEMGREVLSKAENEVAGSLKRMINRFVPEDYPMVFAVMRTVTDTCIRFLGEEGKELVDDLADGIAVMVGNKEEISRQMESEATDE